ncbi:VWA domain-containing protein [Cellulosilyticum sp. ST5]|uniref:von Willebrand factor type A n=1 Tax=Cellulosilyticum lentocellum (strain ATCC 49066 / DSM 5427 / NCIMB 11756 / RHM5) TaxID=642492 RepID=F2JGV8_CELLD|nr:MULTISPECIES: VWA domain-containing protein [Cellulosilyticum]ADZ84200.1 von Willebrand factor type A [Cellulosilyticum lentocellum DSM 5427]QEH69647.1 VWA domain-containing protein [Cellulosilyticum sp. WCF-2]
MIEGLKRPGGEMAARPLHFIWLVDCSGSMMGEKIQSLNYAIKQTIPDMRAAAEENPNAQLYIRAITFSEGAKWHIASPTPVQDFEWIDVEAGGLTDLGKALELVAGQLEMPPMPERALPPVLVLLSDGQPTDTYEAALNQLLSLPWGKKAVKLAIAIGNDADKEVLARFVDQPEMPVLEANNPSALIKYIKWASTVTKQVSSPHSQIAKNTFATSMPIDLATLPTVTTDDALDVW